IDSLSTILSDKIETLKKGFEKFKIKSASKKLSLRVRSRKKGKIAGTVPENKDMIFVQGGKYIPSFFNEEREVGNLEVCKYQTTQDMWMEVMENNPSWHKGGRLPVERVSWWDALEFCNRLSGKYELQPVYVIENGTLKINQLDGEIVYPDLADFKKTEGYRLPTELEWEWFARGGEVAIQDGTFNTTYAGSNNADEVAWYLNNSGNKIHAVGTKKPNELGLYDCSGNVCEWCYDTSDNGYISEDKPYIYDESIDKRRLKGGFWFSYGDDWGICKRSSEGSGYTSSFTGFRVVRSV
ncbi:MAG: formylglycine-generating enzyme family protein, partial [Fusobacteriaceae bacterium]